MNITAEDIAGLVSKRLKSGTFSPGKLAHRIAAHPRAFSNWWHGVNAPPAAHLVKLMAECVELEREILELVRKARDASD